MILISTVFIFQQRTYYEIKRTVTVLTYVPVLAGAITIILTDRNIKQLSLNALYTFEHSKSCFLNISFGLQKLKC